MTLKESISIILKEWNVYHKKILDRGAFKQVYTLQTNPNYIVKKFEIKEGYKIEEEINFCKKYPDLFANIIRVNYEKGWLIQEKLNTKDFLIKFDKLLEDVKNEVQNSINSGYKIEEEDFDSNDFESNVEYIDTIFSHYPKIRFKCFKLNSFASEFYKFLLKTSNLDFLPDDHEGNMGFDKKGNIKLLDV